MLTVPVSVVIPVKDDARLLERCLASLAAQTVRPLEILVVDNGSADESADVARRFGATVLTEREPGIAAASGTGYDAARGRILARCDADSILPVDWLSRIAVRFAADEDLAALTGPGRFYGLTTAQRLLADVLYMRAYFVTVGTALGHPPLFGSNLALRAADWQRVRGEVHRHDLLMHDDIDLSVHLGPVRRIRYDRRLIVEISGRPISDRSGMGLRMRRGFHSLFAHWPAEFPPSRYLQRLRAKRSSARAPHCTRPPA
ncbi:glycosyltransferase family 2 protein [Planctomonas psychrotolerans]|uniref:glycosyltransferase family 2 protein n=1 Tax=Planctomonas psychrotolerans TaxID=2528712 RepID=UPI001D0CF3AE|nr:glycosyltransferase family 2 protein [Planctomonas psychrotolerans]